MVGIERLGNKMLPITIFGYILMGAGILIIIFTVWLTNQGLPPLLFFTITVTAWILLTGIGVIRPSKWGYYLFRVFLIVLFTAFPIGTFISYKTFSYMKENKIKEFFYHESCS